MRGQEPCESRKQKKREGGNQRGREWEGGLVVQAVNTQPRRREAVLPVSLGNSLREPERFSLLLFSLAEYTWPWIKCAVDIDRNSSLVV